MSDSLKVIALAKDSANFVFSNMSVFKTHLKIIFPALLLMTLIESAGKAYEIKYIQLFTLVPILYLYACFALGWHRSSLRGPDESHAINPFNIGSGDWKFVYIFFGIAALPFFVAIIIGVIFGLVYTTNSVPLIAIAGLGVVVASIYLFIQLLRISFLLPAQSVGVSLTLKEARTASKGLIWKLLAAGFMITLVFVVVMFFYALIVGLTLSIMTVGEEPDTTGTSLISFILGIPVLVSALIVAAINVTMLSKAYQWGMQNNA